MKRCYICSQLLTELNTNNPNSSICINCALTMEQTTSNLKKEIKNKKRKREYEKSRS